MTEHPSPTLNSRFRRDNERTDVISKCAHEGKGKIDVKVFFRAATQPALLLIYTIPPGASEGVHAHRSSAERVSFDEFYYILSGNGEMEIDGEKVAVTAGDHFFIPNGVAHGIENTSREADLRVYLIAIPRSH